MVVMGFDEKGQADNYERRVAIAQRVYDLLITKAGFPPHDIIIDPNILTVATGMSEHDRYAIDYIEAVRWIKQNLPGALVSGGVSNLSFCFRGSEPIREAIHTVFLYHAVQAGMDMGIVNAGQIGVYDQIPKDLREHVEDLVLKRRADATERMVTYAEQFKGAPAAEVMKPTQAAWREGTVEERLEARPDPRCHRLHRSRCRRGAGEVRRAGARDRRSAHGGYERRRGSLRLRQDVPAASGEERARDEARRGLSRTLPRREEAFCTTGGNHGNATGGREESAARHRKG